MNNQDFELASGKSVLPFSVKDVLAAAFRYKRTALLCFFGVLTGVILVALLQPARYTSSTEYLVGEGRVDPVVSPDATAPTVVKPVSEEDLNSEVELLHSPDVLRQVVVACGLDKEKRLRDWLFGAPDPEQRIARAAVQLGRDLKIELVKKSNVIVVSYTARDPQAAAQLLKSLTDAYLQKHVAVHSPPGQYDFFAQETERYKKDLSDAEEQLKQFSQEDGGVAPQVSRDLTLQKLAEFRSSLQQTRAELASAEQRVKTLEKQAGITPERLTTARRQLDDAQVLQSLKSTLINLELKRTELLTKYQPNYPLVQEADKQIAETQTAIAAEEAKPIKEETTDRNPTYAWISEELAKARAECSGLQARATATEGAVKRYEDLARDLAQKGLTEQDLERAVKVDEENYLLYLRKREQARMSEALDRTRILNVAVAEPPIVPSTPSNSPFPMLLGGIFFAAAVSVGAVVAQEYLDPSFRTPTEVATELAIPVLAAVPLEGHGLAGNQIAGHGDGQGNPHEYATANPEPSGNLGA